MLQDVKTKDLDAARNEMRAEIDKPEGVHDTEVIEQAMLAYAYLVDMGCGQQSYLCY